MRTFLGLALAGLLAAAPLAQAGGYGSDTYAVERSPSIQRHVYRHYDRDRDYYPRRHYRHHHHHRPNYYDYDDHWSIHYHRPGGWSIHYYD